jgi:hypothetical protein
MVEEWGRMLECHRDEHVFSKIAQWGANQELEACCRWLNGGSKIDYDYAVLLRAARRPQPPSLKEQALDELASAERLYPADWSTIRKALEALPND